MIRNELQKILNIISDKTESNPSSGIMDSAVIGESGLPESEARKYINELAGLELITVGIKFSGADFRMNTNKGIEELQNQEDR